MDLFKKAEKHFQPFNRNHKPQSVSVYRRDSVMRMNKKENDFEIQLRNFRSKKAT